MQKLYSRYSKKRYIFSVVREVVGTKVVKIRNRKGSARWTHEIREAVRKKKETYMRKIHRNFPEEVKERK